MKGVKKHCNFSEKNVTRQPIFCGLNPQSAQKSRTHV
jgi:hypothetical protein